MANKNRKGASISISQVDGKVWDRLLAYAKSNNYNYRVEVDRREAGSSSKLGNKPVNKLVFSRIDEVLRLMGVTRPTRFIGNRFYDDREMPVNNSYSTIINITPLGIGKVIDLQTSEGTYIAEGLVSHNTTFIQIFALDETLFKFKNSGVIAHTREDSEKFFDKKIKFAWDNLPEEIRNAVKLDTDSAKELKFIRRKGDMMEEASISVGTSLRSSTNQILHISELSSVDEKFPEKAKEIMSGALNTVQAKKGNYVFNESTGKVPYGKFYDTVQEAKKNVGKELTVMDYKLHFFPWWEDMKYTLEGEITIPDELNSYFKRLKDEEDITLTREQKNWYYKKSLEQKDDMKREFPSTITECFTADMEGSYYGKWMDEVYQENRIMNVPYTTGIPVDTYWDLGMNDTNVIIFAQQVDLEVRILDCYSMNGEGLEHYANYLKMLMMERGYVYGQHYAPHDIKVRELGTGKSRYETAMSLGITFNIVDPRRGLSIQDGIDCVRNIFKKFYFDEGKTKVLTDALVKYRKDYDDKLGVFKNHPVHDDSSNYADAMRYMAIALRDKGVYVPDKEEVQWIEEQSGDADIINNY